MVYIEHSDSLKLAVVRAYHTPNFTKRQIVSIFGVSSASIYRWVKQAPNFDRTTYFRTTPSKMTLEIKDYIYKRVLKEKTLIAVVERMLN